MGFVFSEGNIRENQIVFIYEECAYSGVRKIAGRVREDVEKVFSAKPIGVEYADLSDTAGFFGYPVFFGTVGNSEILDRLAEDKVINLFDIAGERESYILKIVDGLEFSGFKFASSVIIAGSDKRGTIYGLFRLSEMLGVSPLTDWLDIKPVQKKELTLLPGDSVTASSPSVKYRGFFINDEWPAFGNWCNKNFGGFNAKMYSRIFELLLRLKGNYLWPAMWSAVFYEDGPGLKSAELADELGVIMGTSHHEPCLRQGEEYSHVRGPESVYGDDWNFLTNRDGITRFWADSLKERCRFENVITVGMRGEADTAILRDATLADNIALLRDVIKVQNGLIAENTGRDYREIPRLLALYKEVEPFYYGDGNVSGLKDDPALEGVTVLLCDDNYGNLRTVPPEDERNRSYGMYYHLDYHGLPVSYEWFNTSYLPKIWEQMSAAYDSGIRDLWVVNVGDIFSNEYPLSFFMDLAYDFDRWGTSDRNSAENYTRRFVAANFPAFSEDDADEAAELLLGYTRITALRRTEAMNDSVYAPFAFAESETALRMCGELLDAAEKMYKRLEGNTAFAFYELIYLPLTAGLNVQKMWLLTGLNHAYAGIGSTAASAYADEIRECIKTDRKLVEKLHEIHKGKWYGMGLSHHIGFRHWCDEECTYPVIHTLEGAKEPRLIAVIPSTGEHTEGGFWSGKVLTLPDALNPTICGGFIELTSASSEKVYYTVSTPDDFLSLTVPSKSVKCGRRERIFVFADRMKIKEGGITSGTVVISSGGTDITVRVPVRVMNDTDIPEKTFVYCGFEGYMDYISINAVNFADKKDTGAGSFEIIGRYGRAGAIKAYPQNALFAPMDAPSVVYRILLERAGRYDVTFYAAPSNPCRADGKLLFTVSTGPHDIREVNLIPEGYAVGDRQKDWEKGVLDNIRCAHAVMDLKAGMNELHVGAVSPGFVLEKIVIVPEGCALPYSYLGPPETFRV
ncbi:MAG: glycosyl hydrolase 115 family protein [Lachnospiraceae bacterium]|nr:glycosyl hydrolase 115 family protein [Lachnospiraceae bacterium]